MAKNGFLVFDSDMHIMEPPDLWQRYIDDRYKSAAPIGTTSENVRDLGVRWPDMPDNFRGARGINREGHNYGEEPGALPSITPSADGTRPVRWKRWRWKASTLRSCSPAAG